MWSIQKKSIREHDRRVLQDYLLEIDSRLDKGEGLPDDLPNRAKTFHDIGVINRKIYVDMAQKAKKQETGSQIQRDVVTTKTKTVSQVLTTASERMT
ncbi:hypothetical protein Tco_0875033 [Tanacetum coccineum]|uniref:Uncharacterized protein n=1 Tax=Tanacetum coccineum TaxID=301880 RepID=A0ABQ5BR61_9ASTR